MERGSPPLSLATSTRRKPNLIRMTGMAILKLMAARAWGMISRPDCTGENPSPTW